MKTKYLTKKEREDKAILEMQLMVEKIEKRYKLEIDWNIDDINCL